MYLKSTPLSPISLLPTTLVLPALVLSPLCDCSNLLSGFCSFLLSYTIQVPHNRVGLSTCSHYIIPPRTKPHWQFPFELRIRSKFLILDCSFPHDRALPHIFAVLSYHSPLGSLFFSHLTSFLFRGNACSSSVLSACCAVFLEYFAPRVPRADFLCHHIDFNLLSPPQRHFLP